MGNWVKGRFVYLGIVRMGVREEMGVGRVLMRGLLLGRKERERVGRVGLCWDRGWGVVSGGGVDGCCFKLLVGYRSQWAWGY